MVSRKEWNALADDFEREVCDITRETGSREIDRILRKLKPSPERSVLVDLGCGIGTFVERYGARFRHTYAVEHAARILARARKRIGRREDITFMTSNIPPAVARIGRKADLTVCMNVITMPENRIRAQMWRGIAGVTRKKGHALIVVPSIESDRMVERVAYGTSLADAKKDAPDGLVDRGGSRQKHFARDELRDVLALHGFAVKRLLRVPYPWQKEGLRKPRNAGTRMPWDWLVLAERV
ncbi:MAG: class I SAM-dependent methyltransferase [Proteobacteria bacterium]|nr:class I SAM-dependent methyltransferase [Pseudomonadota bacterium]